MTVEISAAPRMGDEIRAEIDAATAARVARVAAQMAARKTTAQTFKRRRDYGLTRRHAEKLARLNERNTQ